MATFKLNIARIQGSPQPAEVGELLAEYGLPEGDEFGVLNHTVSDVAVFGTVIRRTQTAVQKLDPETQEVLSQAVERVQLLPFGLRPGSETLEVYQGAKSAIEQMGVFLGSCLALPTVVEPLTLDIPAAIDYLLANTQRFQLKSVRVNEYAHNSFMLGPYTPKFLDSEHGREFMEQYAEFVTSASVRFQGPTGRVNVTLKPLACLSFSCNEDDQPQVQSLLRKLVN